MRTIIAAMLVLAPSVAFGQTCPAAPADPIPRDAVRLNWMAPTQWEQGGNIPATAPITYTIYEVIGGTNTKRCETTLLTAGQTGLSVGDHTWVVTAKHPASSPPNIESVPSNSASRTVAAPPLTPRAPITFVVTGSITLTPVEQ